MSPDQPGAPAPSENGGTATFGPGVEQAEREATEQRVATEPPEEAAPREEAEQEAPRPPRRPTPPATAPAGRS